jgi:hypothetical protein
LHGTKELGQDALDVEVEDYIDHYRDYEEEECDHSEDIDPVADAFEIFE